MAVNATTPEMAAWPSLRNTDANTGVTSWGVMGTALSLWLLSWCEPLRIMPCSTSKGCWPTRFSSREAGRDGRRADNGAGRAHDRDPRGDSPALSGCDKSDPIHERGPVSSNKKDNQMISIYVDSDRRLRLTKWGERFLDPCQCRRVCRGSAAAAGGGRGILKTRGQQIGLCWPWEPPWRQESYWDG